MGSVIKCRAEEIRNIPTEKRFALSTSERDEKSQEKNYQRQTPYSQPKKKCKRKQSGTTGVKASHNPTKKKR